jgi:acylphosphatase
MAKPLSGPARFHAVISGRVQMVGFRAFAEARALRYRATGYVRNLSTGEVEVVAEGDRSLLEQFAAELRKGPRGAYVRGVRINWEAPRGEFRDFSIRFGYG